MIYEIWTLSWYWAPLTNSSSSLTKPRLWVVGGESWRAQPAPAPGAAQLCSNSRTGHSWRCSSGQPQLISWQVTAWQPPVWCEQILAASVTGSDNIMRAASCDAQRCHVWSEFLFLEQNILCVQSKHRCGHPVIILTSLFRSVPVFWCFIFFWKYKWNNWTFEIIRIQTSHQT